MSATGANRIGMCIAQTRVHTEDGPVAIDQLRVGQRAWTREDAGGSSVLRTIIDVFTSEPRPIRKLAFGFESSVFGILFTDDQPIWVVDKGWVPARDVRAGRTSLGDFFLLRDGRQAHCCANVPVIATGEPGIGWSAQDNASRRGERRDYSGSSDLFVPGVAAPKGPSVRLDVRTHGLVLDGGAGCFVGAKGLWVGPAACGEAR